MYRDIFKEARTVWWESIVKSSHDQLKASGELNLLPVWTQNGIIPSPWVRWGPLKLDLYSKRRCGGSSLAVCPRTEQWNSAEASSRHRCADSSFAMDTAIFSDLFGCWRIAVARTAWRETPEGPTGRSLIGRERARALNYSERLRVNLIIFYLRYFVVWFFCIYYSLGLSSVSLC